MDKRFLTLSEAAVLMGKSVQTIRRLIKKGELQGQRIRTPQGFHYVVSMDDLAAQGYVVQKEMFSDSPIQNIDFIETVEEKSVAPYQGEMLINQHAEQPHKEKDFYAIDRQTQEIVVKQEEEVKALHAIIDAYHQEKIILLHLLGKLQDKLLDERVQPKGFWGRWFS